jgi:hypothetical protein
VCGASCEGNLQDGDAEVGDRLLRLADVEMDDVTIISQSVDGFIFCDACGSQG